MTVSWKMHIYIHIYDKLLAENGPISQMIFHSQFKSERNKVFHYAAATFHTSLCAKLWSNHFLTVWMRSDWYCELIVIGEMSPTTISQLWAPLVASLETTGRLQQVCDIAICWGPSAKPIYLQYVSYGDILVLYWYYIGLLQCNTQRKAQESQPAFIIIANVCISVHHGHRSKSMGSCKKDVTPVCLQWSYIFLALTHRNNG